MAQAAPWSRAAATKACPSRFGPRMATKPSPLASVRVSMEKPVTGVARAPREAPLVAPTISPSVQSGSATTRLLPERGGNRVVVGERDHRRADGLASLVALAGDQQNVAALEPRHRVGDGRGTIADLDSARRGGQDLAADRGRAFATWIVVGDNGEVCLRR